MNEQLLVIDKTGDVQNRLRECGWQYLEPSLSALINPKPITDSGQTLRVTLVAKDSLTRNNSLESIRSSDPDTLIVVVSQDQPASMGLQEPVQQCVCTVEDISNQYVNQLFLIARQAMVIRQLRHESHCYREMVDSCPDYVFIRDRENRIVFVNTALAELHEMTPLDMVGKTYVELTGDEEGGRHAAIQDGEILNSGKPYYLPEDYYHDERGAVQWNRVTKKRIPNADGTSHFVLGVATDLTEWKKNEVQLQESESRYRELYMREQVLGKISETISAGSDAFSDQEAELLGAIADQCMISITKIALNNQIQHQAILDSLTDLPNRLYFERLLKQQLSASHSKPEPFCVLFLDLDGFKLINDSYGHLVGDKVLQVVAQRYSTAIGDYGWVARMGGDEFSFRTTRNIPVKLRLHFSARKSKLSRDVAYDLKKTGPCTAIG